jgi:hypothetical protein
MWSWRRQRQRQVKGTRGCARLRTRPLPPHTHHDLLLAHAQQLANAALPETHLCVRVSGQADAHVAGQLDASRCDRRLRALAGQCNPTHHVAPLAIQAQVVPPVPPRLLDVVAGCLLHPDIPLLLLRGARAADLGEDGGGVAPKAPDEAAANPGDACGGAIDC